HARWYAPPVHRYPGVQERDHHALGWPDAAGQGLLQRHRSGLVGPGHHQARRCERRWRPQLAHRAPGGAGPAEGADPLQHRLGVGRPARRAAKPCDRQHGLCAAEDQPASGRAWHPLHLPPERDPELAGVRERRSLQRAGVLMMTMTYPRRTLARLCAATLFALAAGPAAWAQATPWHDIGRDATPAEVKAWDIDVRPDFKGLPKGSGSVSMGEEVWIGKCAACHGDFGESNEVFTPIVGGTTQADIERGRVKNLELGSTFPQKTTMMKVATVSTLWD